MNSFVDDNDDNKVVHWSNLGIIGSIVCVVVVTMWTVTGSLNKLVDKLEATDQKINTRLVLLENNKITQDRLINWETRFISIEKDVSQIIANFEKNCIKR